MNRQSQVLSGADEATLLPGQVTCRSPFPRGSWCKQFNHCKVDVIFNPRMRDLNTILEIIIESLYRSILVHILIPKHSHCSHPWRVISDQGLTTRFHHPPTPQTPSSTMEWRYKHYLPCLSFLSLSLLDLRGWSFEPLIHFPQCTWSQTGCEHIVYTLEVFH